MPKFFIKLRKRLILPIRWGRLRKKEISEIKFPDPKDVLAKRDELIQEILKAEREEKDGDLAIATGRLKLINWFIGK